MTFLQWLRTQNDRDDPVGDFAKDALADRQRPVETNRKSAWINHLSFMNACDNAIQAFYQAWDEWEYSDRWV